MGDGVQRDQRPGDGLISVAKPVGVTSRDVVDRVSRAFRQKRCGHAGTLDPLAEGVVVVLCGQGTRLVTRVQETTKVYQAEFLLGLRSETDDVCGAVRPVWNEAEPMCPAVSGERNAIRARVLEFVPPAAPDGFCWPDEATIRQVLSEFEGDVEQVPPVYSAVKIEGRRAYDLARKGKAVDLEARVVRIERVVLLTYAPPRLTVEIECGSGTYVRAVGRDLGERLGIGAVMSRLVRTRVGPFALEGAVALDRIQKGAAGLTMSPLDEAVGTLPRYVCDEAAACEILHGRVIARPELATSGTDGGEYALLAEGRLLGLARYDAGANCLRPFLVLPRGE